MTYYKHVKREANSQVNWAEVGKKISDSLIQVRDEREKRKAEIDEASRQFGEQLANAPQGENQEMNEFINDAARDTAELRRIQDNLLRSGMMKMRDYSRSRQNLTDGWSNFAKLGEEYNTEWAEKMARAQNGEGSLQELYEMEQIEGFANFTEAKMYIDPMTGKISMGHRVQGEDGTYGSDIDMEKPLMTINEMRERLKRKINRYDVIDGLTPVVDALGQNVEVLRRAGIETIDDITGRELSDDQREALGLFRSAQENALNSILSSPDVASSIMSDYVNVVDGQQVRFTSNEEELSEGDHVMLLKRNEKSGDLFFEPTEEQRDILFNALRDQMDIMLDIKETPMARDFQAERERRGSGKATEEQMPLIFNLAQLWYGDSNEVDEAVKFLGNLKPGLIGGKDIQFIDRLEDKVVITYRVNGEERTQDLDFYDDEGNLKTQEEFIKGYSSFFGISDVSKALSRSEFDPNRDFGTGTGRFEIKRPVEPIKPFDEQFEVIDSNPVSITELLSEVNQNTQPSTVVSTVRSSFKELPEDKKRGLDTEIVEHDPPGLGNAADLLKIFLPQVMDQPVFIPKEDASFNADLQSVLNRIYDAAANNETISTDSDLAGFITNYDEYNTANIRSLYGTTTSGSAGSGGSGGTVVGNGGASQFN
jgi:hypothetical protein